MRFGDAKGSRNFTVSLGPLFLAAILFLFFQNCFYSNTVLESGLSSKSIRLASSSGGDGVPFGGKPEGWYLRYVPDFYCSGKPSPLSSIAVLDGLITYKQNDAFMCDFTNRILSYDDLDISPFQNYLMGYDEGIYENIYGATQEVPASLAEIWCQSSQSPSDFEVIVHYDRDSKLANAKIYFNDAQSFDPRMVTDYGVSRIVQDSQVIVKANNFSLIVDKNAPVSNYSGQYLGEIMTLIDNQAVRRDLRCRLGGELDPKFWPVKQITQMRASSQVKTSSSKIGPKKFAFSSYIVNDGNQQTTTDYNHLYITSENPNSSRRLSASADMNKLGFRDFVFSPDGRYIYYRLDDEISHYFGLYQLDLNDGKTRKLPGKGLSGAGTNAVSDGGVLVASDGTLIYISDLVNGGQSRIGYISGTDPTANPKFIENPVLAGQISLYAYSAVYKEVVFFMSKATPHQYDLLAQNILNGKKRTLLSNTPIFGYGKGFEFGDLLVFFRSFGLFPNISLEQFVLNPATLTLKSYGVAQPDNSSTIGTIWKQNFLGINDPLNWIILKTESGDKVIGRDLEFELPDSYTTRMSNFSNNKEHFWWNKNNVIYQVNRGGRIETACSLEENSQVIAIFPKLEKEAVALVYKRDKNIIEVFHMADGGIKSRCTFIASLPLELLQEGILSGAVSPNGDYLVFTANIEKINGKNFVAYSVPLDGETPVASTVAGSIHSYSSRIEFSNDSKKAFLIFTPQGKGGHIHSWDMPPLRK